MLKIGLFATGLDTYWSQFDGLLDHLNDYRRIIAGRINAAGADIECADAGMVDSPEKAKEAAKFFSEQQVDIVFLYVATYCLSSTILPVAQRLNCPVVVLNLQPTSAIDYDAIYSLQDKGKMTGLWLENCQACSIPEIANVFNRAGLRYEIVSGHLNDCEAMDALHEWIDAARVYKGMRENRMGILGHYYCGMLDVYTDLTKQSAVFGTHIEIVEMCELKKIRDAVTRQEVDRRIEEFNEAFEVSAACDLYELQRAAKTSVALDRLIEGHDLGSMAYYYEGEGEMQDISTSVIAGNTLLTGKGIPVAGECEFKNAQAMKIMSLLGAGGSFSEFYAMDFDDDVVLFGHDAPVLNIGNTNSRYRFNCGVACLGGEMVVTRDLKSLGQKCPCGFDSRPRHKPN